MSCKLVMDDDKLTKRLERFISYENGKTENIEFCLYIASENNIDMCKAVSMIGLLKTQTLLSNFYGAVHRTLRYCNHNWQIF